MSEAPDIWLIVIAVIAIAVSALLSAAEAALVRMTRVGAAEMLAAGRPNARLVVDLVAEPERALGAASFFRFVLETTTAVCLTLVFYSTFEEWWWALLIGVVVMIAISFLLTGMSPRSIGRARPRQTLSLVAPLLKAADVVLAPVVVLSRRLRPAAARRPAESTSLSADELREIVDRVSEADRIEDEEREMLQSIIELGDTRTREVMVPRTEIVTVAAGTPLRKAQSLFLRSGFSRVPVIGDSVDDLLGVLYFKDVVRRISADPRHRDEDVRTVMRPGVFVPDSKPVDELLRQLQRETTHIAMVVDEYGGIAGLVTIEDAIEEIVGELTDEHDHSARDVEDLGDGRFRVPSRLPIDELGDLFGLTLDDDDVDSVGGLLAKALGKVPIVGSEAVVQGVRLVAERTEGRRKQVATILATRDTVAGHDSTKDDEDA